DRILQLGAPGAERAAVPPHLAVPEPVAGRSGQDRHLAAQCREVVGPPPPDPAGAAREHDPHARLQVTSTSRTRSDGAGTALVKLARNEDSMWSTSTGCACRWLGRMRATSNP